MERNPRLLDIACGTGWAVSYASRVAKGHGEFYGVDISSKMIDKAEANFARYGNLHFFRANADSLPFDDGFFDYIICTNAFHHFSNPDQVVREAYRVLKPCGRIYILDTTADSSIIKMLDRLSKKIERSHVKIYSTQEYQSLFQRAGLNYSNGESIVFFIKIHVGEKSE